MIRYAFILTALAAVLVPCHRSPAAMPVKIITETTANRHGLTRPWFTQIQMDRGRTRVKNVVLQDGTLYVQTDRAMVHCSDAETGKTRWARQIGRPNHPSLRPGVSDDLLAVVGGSRLDVCNPYNGDRRYEVEVGGMPGAGAAMSKRYAYVPMVDGMVLAYSTEPLTETSRELDRKEKDLTDEEKADMEETRRESLRLRQQYVPPLACRSMGRIMVQPLITMQNEHEEYCVWSTERGYLNVGRIDRRDENRLALEFRLETDSGIAGQPAYMPGVSDEPGNSGTIYIASQDGFVYAVRENDGDLLWRFSTGEPIVRPVVVVARRVYVATQLGGMYCIDATVGREIWLAPRVVQFVAASKDRIYAADKLERIIVFDAKTGSRIDTIQTIGLNIKLANSETDRIYLGTDTGMIQCLHEIELTEPILHGAVQQKAPLTVEQKGMEELPKPETEEKPPAKDDLFGGDEKLFE